MDETVRADSFDDAGLGGVLVAVSGGGAVVAAGCPGWVSDGGASAGAGTVDAVGGAAGAVWTGARGARAGTLVETRVVTDTLRLRLTASGVEVEVVVVASSTAEIVVVVDVDVDVGGKDVDVEPPPATTFRSSGELPGSPEIRTPTATPAARMRINQIRLGM